MTSYQLCTVSEITKTWLHPIRTWMPSTSRMWMNLPITWRTSTEMIQPITNISSKILVTRNVGTKPNIISFTALHIFNLLIKIHYNFISEWVNFDWKGNDLFQVEDWLRLTDRIQKDSKLLITTKCRFADYANFFIRTLMQNLTQTC